MPTRDGYPEGVPSWADLATTHLDAAKAFYSALFGWEYSEEETGDPAYKYSMAMQKGLPAAGLGQAQEGQPFSVWTTYFAVDDAQATADKVRNAGGSIIMDPVDVMDHGRLGIFGDPTGAVFGVWETGSHHGAAIVNEHGAMNWNELQTDDIDTALAFYANVLGHTHETSEGVSGPYTAVSAGDRVIAGAMTKPAAEIPNNWGVYFAVDDASRAIETALANGGEKIYGPMTIEEVGIFAGLTDPTGAVFTVIELANEVD
jgi:hypothetical protein